MSIEISQSDLARVESLLRDIKNGSKRALTNAINKTLTNVQTRAAKDIGADLALTAKRIKQNFTVSKANFSDMSGSFTSKGVPIGLINFAARQTKKGVSFKVKRSGGRTTLKHAFVARGKAANDGTRNEKTHVFWRGKVYGKKVNPKMNYGALPKKYRFTESADKDERGIQRRTGPRIEDILGANRIFDPIETFAGEKISENLSTQIDDILRRHNG